jgi:trehalose synthase
MIPRLSHYSDIIGSAKTREIRAVGRSLEGRHIVHLNSTSAGGGVAEILNTLVFLMHDVGINTGWRVILGSHSFFKVTKGMHNALQGKPEHLTENRKRIYIEYCKRNALINHLAKHDLVVAHDPQPLGMIANYKTRGKWIWRCHIDLSHPQADTMRFLLPYIKRYDAAIISSEKFRIRGVGLPQSIIPPSIDPLSQKNKEISGHAARSLLEKKGIDPKRPILCQISRFDPWKGQLGVIQAFEKVQKKQDCQLVLMGDMASDDPEGPAIFYKIKQIAEKNKDIHLITEKNDLLVNALQKEAAIVFQNSVKEGFALTVAEALWKKTPVLGTNVGGIPLQVLNGKTGFIINGVDDAATKALLILNDKDTRLAMGRAGHDHVKKNFLITRHLHDYLNLFDRTLNRPRMPRRS